MTGPRKDRVGEHRTALDKNRKIILRTQDICGICGLPVDKNLKYPNPLSATVDHIIPIAKGGHPSDLANLQLAHRYCNRMKSDKLLPALPKDRDRENTQGKKIPPSDKTPGTPETDGGRKNTPALKNTPGKGENHPLEVGNDDLPQHVDWVAFAARTQGQKGDK